MKSEKTVYPAILLAITFGVVGPFQMYLTNSTELWFGIGDIWWIPLLGGTAILAICLLLSILLPPNWSIFFNCLLFGIAIGMYLQGNYINAYYGVLDGHTIDWSQYTSTAVVNTVIWLICLAVPLIAVRLRPDWAKKGLKWISLFLIAVQILALGIMLATTDLDTKESVFASTKGINEVSEEGNVIVFILDSFDDLDIKELLETEPDFFSELDGFTYFTNNTGMYPTTIGSLPFILTGEVYRNEQPYSSYVEEAFSKTDYYEDLKEAGYDIALYTGTHYLNVELIKDYVSNLAFDGVKVSSPLGMLGSLYKFTGFRYFPHLLKPFVWFYGGEFGEYKVAVKSEQKVYSYSNIPYYDSLVQEGLSLTEGGKRYRLIHLDGAHFPYNLAEDLRETDDGSATRMSQSKAALNIVYEYIRQLKELGVYDQSTLLIISDHGLHSLLAGRPTNPIFFAKGQNYSGSLQLSNAPVSQADIQATIMSDLGLNDSEKYGRSAFSIKEGENRDRHFLLYSLNDDNYWNHAYLPPMHEYYILPDGNEENNFYLTGMVYTEDGFENRNLYEEYVLGDEILFTEESDGTRYFSSGIFNVETSFAWSSGHFGRMCLDFGEVQTHLTATIEFANIYAGSQHVVIKNYNEVLYDGTVTQTNPVISFYVPEHCFNEGKLMLDFEYPDAVSPASMNTGSADVRLLAVGFKKIRFTGIPEYTPGNDIIFTEESDGRQYFTSGISVIEKNTAWSVGTSGQMQLCIDGDVGGLTAEFTFRSLYTPPQKFIVRCGDRVLYDAVLNSVEEPVIFSIPAACIENGRLLLDLEYPDAVSPESRGTGVDKRALAFRFYSIRFDADSKGYTLGNDILFTEESDGIRYFLSGISGIETNASWSLGTGGQMLLHVDGDAGDLTAEFTFQYIYAPPQRFIVRCGDQVLYDAEVNSAEKPVTFTVPAVCIEDGLLLLDLEYPDAVSPKSRGDNKDVRKLAFLFYKIRFYEGIASIDVVTEEGADIA